MSSRKSNSDVVCDPHTVYRDAVRTSAWNTQASHLPQREDWSTFRYAVKDIVLAVATHRYDRPRRRLEVRAYFTGEHPAYEAFEPTRILFLILASQAWQSGRRMELHFEGGIPWDLRLYVEKLLGEQLSGHSAVLSHDIGAQLYQKLTDVPPTLLASAEGLSPEHICFHIHRGTWSARQVRLLWRRDVPLTWVFRARPDPVRDPLSYTYLLKHLMAVSLEEYAIARMTGKEEGSRCGTKLEPSQDDIYVSFIENLSLAGPDALTAVTLMAGEPALLVPVLQPTTERVVETICLHENSRIRPVFVVPLDILGAPEAALKNISHNVQRVGGMILAAGLTLLQLKAEAELHLAITALQADEFEVSDAWSTRYAE